MKTRPSPSFWILSVLVTVGAALRIYQIQYGLPQVFHPDEPHIILATQRFFAGDWNPHNFLYPSFLMYLIHVVQRGVALFQHESLALPQLYLIGRLVVAAFGTATIVVVYWTAKRLFNRQAGWIAAALQTFAVLHIVNSHSATTDVPVTFFSSQPFVSVCG